MGRGTFSFLAAALAASAQAAFFPAALAGSHDALVAKHAAANGVPEHLVHRVIRIESRGNAAVVHRGNYGLMQIRLGTARGVGYSGDAKGLLDPDTNLTYAVRYLAGAYRAAGCDADRTVKYYQRGYYGAARRECGAPLPAKAAVAVDVIKPKVVRTEVIAAPKSGLPPARPVGNFEPARVAPPPVEPVVASNPLPVKPATMPKTDTPQLIVAEPAAKVALAFVPLPPVRLEPAVAAVLASVPLPPVRPAVNPPPKPIVQPIHRPERARARAGKKAMVAVRSETESKSKTESKPNAPDPAGVVSFLKKLVAPDKKSQQRLDEAQADPPSQIQPPQ
jgi:Transglycosylase SLT domain